MFPGISWAEIYSAVSNEQEALNQINGVILAPFLDDRTVSTLRNDESSLFSKRLGCRAFNLHFPSYKCLKYNSSCYRNVYTKFSVKFLSIFGIEAQGCFNVDHFRFKCDEKRQNLAKFPI